MKKKLIFIGLVLLLITYTIFGIISYADNSRLFVNLQEEYYDAQGNPLGVGYGIGDASQSGGAKIWYIASYDSATATAVSTQQRNLYCVKANYGDTWNSGDDAQYNKVTYNLEYDLQEQRKAVFDALGTTAGANSVVKDILDPSKEAYRQILWILDNSFVKGKTDKTEFLSKIGITGSNEEYSYQPVEGYDYSSVIGALSANFSYTKLLTDEDINAIQKAAIWYYTNYKLDQSQTEPDFNQEDLYSWLTATSDNGASYEHLATLDKDRNIQAVILYNYLIDAAENNKGNYTAENNYTLPTNPVNVNTAGLNTVSASDSRYRLEAEIKDGKLIAGPIKINKNNDTEYKINLIVTDSNGAPISASNYEFTDATGAKLENVSTINDLVGNADGFYIKVDETISTQIDIQIDITTQVTDKKLWLQGTESRNASTDEIGTITLNAEQPIVEVIRTINTETVKFYAEYVEKEKIFDLALRKYITAVNNNTLEALNIPQRVPSISETTLKTGTTATYAHKKDPVLVETGDIVTYNITIYNEGEKAGYASQVIDQLPAGLIYNPSSSIVSKDPTGADKNTYAVTYDPTLNKITFDIDTATAKELNPYETDNLDYETLEIKCKVIYNPKNADSSHILTNVAWISGAYDTTDNVIATDRDSQPIPESSPSVDKDSMENYKGNSSNKNDLTDSQYFYKGEQDDDDFEKLYVKIFDLALRKYITAVGGEEVTTRIPDPDLSPLTDNSKTTTTANYNHPKTPVPAKVGDIVEYTIRVYNEGEVDGYANEVKDYLPPHLEFVTDSTTNTKYGWTISTDGRVATTTYLSNKEISKFDGTTLDYEDLKIECKILSTAVVHENITNIAEISEYKYGDAIVPEDIDSESDNIDENMPQDSELPNYKKDKENDAYVPGNEDDDDFEKVYIEIFDLSLRKFITAIAGEEITNREPIVDVSPLLDNSDETTTAIYNHPKTPVVADKGDTIVYTIRVYNEGEIDGYANEVKDYLSPYLEFVEDSEINEQYGWTISSDGRIATTKYLSNKEISKFNGTALDYEDIKIECKILGTAVPHENITNIAEISEYKYDDAIVPEDIDSESDNIDENMPEDKDLPNYKKDKENDAYVPGNEDDDDFEKVYVREFDLALRKFITQIQDKEVTVREPQVKIEEGKISYEHPKEPLLVHVGDTVIYTIRVYNEGEIAGYASEITDDIPEYLEYLPQHDTNTEYMWKMYDENGNETENVAEAVKVKTLYLSKDNEQEDDDNLLVAFDGQEVDYRDIKIAFKVKDPNSNEYIITNHAQISGDTDKDGDPIDDIDSEPDEWNEGEDDQDIENIKVQYFDLALLKYVTKVIVVEDGVEKVTETGYNGLEDPEPVVKVELHRKKLNNVVVKFGYGIKIINEGDIAGYATEITDYIPDGLKFLAEDNPTWKDEGNNVISTKALEGTLLQPGESATIEVILTWINGENNLMEKTNTAEISMDDNEDDIPDKDSDPDNKVPEEDDIDIAKVILTISTGKGKTYFTLTLSLLTILAIGIFLIKKFVI